MVSIGVALGLDQGGTMDESIVKGIREAASSPSMVASLFSTSYASTSSSVQYSVFSPSTNLDQYRVLRELVSDTATIREENGQHIRLLCKSFGPTVTQD